MAYSLHIEGEPYDILHPWRTLDPWQIEYIESEGNCALLTGRQTGKSTAMSIKAAELAIHKHKKGEDIMMVALTERQAYLIFNKCLNYLLEEYPKQVCKGLKKPTKHEINLKNGVKIMCHPTGMQGEGLRGFPLKKFMCDEASRVSDEVFTAMQPTLSVIGGSMDIASTPCGAIGFFYRAFPESHDEMSKAFKQFRISAEDCGRHKKEKLEEAKNSMSALEYAQEYLGVFLTDLRRLFSDEVITKSCKRNRGQDSGIGSLFLGVDIARLGDDRSAFQVINRNSKNKLFHVESITTTKQLTTQTTSKIIELDGLYHFKRIYIDAGAGSLGVGIYDFLLETPLKNKIVAINNRKRVLDREGKSTQRLLKEDLYNNLLGLMERGEIELLKDDDVIESLKSVQWEYLVKEGQATQLHIFSPEHTASDVVEGLIRAAWCAKDKSLNLWAA